MWASWFVGRNLCAIRVWGTLRSQKTLNTLLFLIIHLNWLRAEPWLWLCFWCCSKLFFSFPFFILLPAYTNSCWLFWILKPLYGYWTLRPLHIHICACVCVSERAKQHTIFWRIGKNIWWWRYIALDWCHRNSLVLALWKLVYRMVAQTLTMCFGQVVVLLIV